MKPTHLARAFVVGCAVAAAAACGNTNRNTSDDMAAGGNANPNTAANQQAAGNQTNAPISIDGCLQKGSGGTYLLTRINEPAHKDVGTTGPASSVEQEQLWLARNEYRIDPAKDVKIDDSLVGKQVHVTGTIADRADLPTAQQQQQQAERDMRDRPAATSGASANGSNASDKGADISQGDLAKIDASAVSMVADSCGSAK
jgi:hypothetical protein